MASTSRLQSPWPSTTSNIAYEYSHAHLDTASSSSGLPTFRITRTNPNEIPRTIPDTWLGVAERLETQPSAPRRPPPHPKSLSSERRAASQVHNRAAGENQSTPRNSTTSEPGYLLVSEGSSQADRSRSKQPPENSEDELFFDAPTVILQDDSVTVTGSIAQESHANSLQRPGQNNADHNLRPLAQRGGQRTRSARTNVSNDPLNAAQAVDWQDLDAPQELIHSNEATSQEIKDLLKSSIERVADQPVQPLEPEEPVTYYTASNSASASSLDSGYGSVTPEPEKKSKGKKALGGLASLFRRKDGRVAPSIADAIGSSSTGMVTAFPSVWPSVPVITRKPLPVTDTTSSASTPANVPEPSPESLIFTALTSEAQWPPKCCLNPIPSATIIRHLPADLVDKYKTKDLELSTPAAERVYCSRANCNLWIPPKNISKASSLAKCATCKQKTCSICRGEAHNGQDCPDDPSLRATDNLAEIEGWKKCYSCHAYVEHNTGCRHMTCRCKAEFCYVCGLRWRTCGCSESDLAVVRTRNLARHEAAAAALARDDAAAMRDAEEREILRLVEEFEREEAERLAREAEQERIEAARRAEEQRRRIEEERISRVHFQFANFRTELESLHAIQQVLLAERHEFEEDCLRREYENKKDSLTLRSTAQEQLFHAESQSRLSDANYRLNREYQTRQAKGRKDDEKYYQDLVAHYRGKEGADEMVRTVFDERIRDEQRHFETWYKVRQAELSDLVETERREMARLSKDQKLERQKIEKDNFEKRELWTKRCDADVHWVDAVIAERERMLNSMEQEEYARV
ncbi:hypothetical protein BP6252_01894 [Coleophoma cylindrospora]|uniref:RBR-type E3 ubiquitin transferase n=1 Tax=Coleophoma cylindrospora TaxID=1849047 RepID=A0A3D8SDX5_9HELO|nr:hypothetical protein BP6252_01894 [Coleophoma cylindrospora]